MRAQRVQRKREPNHHCGWTVFTGGIRFSILMQHPVSTLLADTRSLETGVHTNVHTNSGFSFKTLKHRLVAARNHRYLMANRLEGGFYGMRGKRANKFVKLEGAVPDKRVTFEKLVPIAASGRC